MWALAWRACEAGAGVVGLAGLGVATGWAGWVLGNRVRDWGGLDWLQRAELEGLARRLRLAAPGEPRLAAIRRLFAWHKSVAGSRWLTQYGEEEVEKLMEGMGRVVDPLVLALISGPGLPWDTAGQMSASRARFLGQADLQSLRLHFLASEDRGVDATFLGLFSLPTLNLARFHSDTLLLESDEPWVVECRAVLGRCRDFLREPEVVNKIRALLRHGDPNELLPATLRLYELVHREEPYENLNNWKECYGSLFLLRPVLDELLDCYDSLPLSSKGALTSICFHLNPTTRAEEAAELVEGFLLPQLARAERLSPDLLRWLPWAFPTNVFAVPPWNPLIPAPFVNVFDSTSGRSLRSQIFAAFVAALKPSLSSAQCKSLVWGILRCPGADFPVEPAHSHRLEEAAELVGRVCWALQQLPMGRAERWETVCVLLRLRPAALGEAAASRLLREGGLCVLARLLRLHSPPFPGRLLPPNMIHAALLPTNDYYEVHVGRLLLETRRLLVTDEQVNPGDPVYALGGAEAKRRLLAWADSGLEGLLRRLAEDEPPPGTFHLRHLARRLLDGHDALRHAQLPNLQQPSRLPAFPAPLHYPLH